MTRMPSPFLPLPSLRDIAARRTASRVETTPEEEESIARRAGRIALGGIGAVGNFLDVPGSMVRDVVAGENPLDQLLHPFSSTNRTTGRDLTRKWGLAGSKDTWGNFLGGLGVDIALDPLTYVFPFGAATKAGRLVKQAGVSGNVRAIAAKTAKAKVGTFGPRQAAVRTTLSDVLRHSTPEEVSAIQTAAAKQGINLTDLADEPLRGMFGLGVLGSPKKVMGFGPKAEKFASQLDEVGRTIRYGKIPGLGIAPVDTAAKLFNAKLGGVPGEVGQIFARKAFTAREAARAKANTQIAEYTRKLVDLGWGDESKANLLRGAFEEVQRGTSWHKLTPEVQQVVQDAEKFKDSIREGVLAEGGKIAHYESPLAKHWPRYGLQEEFPEEILPSGGGISKPFDMRNPSARKRNPIFSPFTDEEGAVHAIADETTTLRKLIQDEDLENAIIGRRPIDEVAGIIERKYGNVIPKYFKDTTGAVKDRYAALGKWIANLPEEHRKLGFFANHPVLDLHSYAVSGASQAAGLRSLREYILSKGVLHNPGKAARQEGYKTLHEALNGVAGHVDPKVFGKRLWDDVASRLTPQQVGMFRHNIGLGLGKKAADVSDHDIVRYLLKNRVSDETATAISRIATGFQNPQPVQGVLKAVDSVTNFWKGYQTGIWPAFHTRNLLSGQVNNWLTGNWSLQSVRDTNALLSGKVVKDAASIPAVQQLARERGVQLTPETATDLLGELAYAHNMTGRYAGEVMSQAGVEGIAAPQRLADLSSEIPRVGFSAFSLRRIGRKAIGREIGTSWNPLAVRGVRNRVASGFAPAAAGEEASHIVEGFNRISAFVHQLRRGIDPQQAAAEVLRSQAVYDARYFTPFEREIMQRAMPFFKFSKGMAVWMPTELMQRPSGKLAQLLRGANRMRNPDIMTPDYVAETTSVPLGEDAEGGRSYLTGAGLMMEDPLGFLGSGVRGGLLEAGSRLNPLLKAPLEWMTGQSFFQKGPMGGRSLEDLDPTIGRTLANLTGQREAVRWPGSEGLEFAVANSPLSRLTTTARQLTGPLRAARDPLRKGSLLPESLKTAVNLLTGARITRVSPAAQDALLRERTQQLMRRAGSKTFVKSYIPEEVEASMTPEELEEARKLEALMNTLARRSKARAEARAAADTAAR